MSLPTWLDWSVAHFLMPEWWCLAGCELVPTGWVPPLVLEVCACLAGGCDVAGCFGRVCHMVEQDICDSGVLLVQDCQGVGP